MFYKHTETLFKMFTSVFLKSIKRTVGKENKGVLDDVD